MDGRETILRRIREALRISAPHPNAGHGIHPAAPQHAAEPEEFEQWLPDSGETREQQLQKFAENCEGLKTAFLRVSSMDEALDHIREIADREHWKHIAAHHGELTDRIVENLGLPCLHTDGGYEVNLLESCDAGITECDSMVAQTGSILLSTQSAGGRALSVLPPHHVVLARESQMVPDLAAALEQAGNRYAGNMPSYLGFITGPSRTGDIERILVLGAHGPKRLTVICLAN